MELVRLRDLPQVTRFTVAELGLGYPSSVLVRSHRLPNINVCHGGLSLTKIKGSTPVIYKVLFILPQTGSVIK